MIDDKDLVNKLLLLKCSKPKKKEKKQFGEVFTPQTLINEMLDKLPKEVWKNSTLRWFDPAVGIGNFMIEIYYRLMEGLVEQFPDFEMRKTHIISNMLYMSELNPANTKTCRCIFGNGLNIYEGDTLGLDTSKVFGVDAFDIIVGNPPYQGAHNNRGRNNLWSKFVDFTINHLKDAGYLLFIHPSGWRQVNGLASEILKKYDMEYLSIHNEKDGNKTFKSSTRYDWYLIKKKQTQNYITEISNEKRIAEYINIKKLIFIPNYNIEKISNLTNTSKNDFIIHNSSFHTVNIQKGLLSKIQTSTYNIKIVNSVNVKNQPKLLYANFVKDATHFVPKIIFGSGATGFLKDYKGEYGMTGWSSGIVVNSDDIDDLMNYLISADFKELRTALSITQNEINYKALKYFKKDFWKVFTNNK